jgi:hypothetical protein
VSSANSTTHGPQSIGRTDGQDARGGGGWVYGEYLLHPPFLIDN